MLGGGAFVGVYFIIKRKNSGKELPKALAWIANLFAKKETSTDAEAIASETEETEISKDVAAEPVIEEIAEPIEEIAEPIEEATEPNATETEESTEAEETAAEADNVSDENSEDKEN